MSPCINLSGAPRLHLPPPPHSVVWLPVWISTSASSSADSAPPFPQKDSELAQPRDAMQGTAHSPGPDHSAVEGAKKRMNKGTEEVIRCQHDRSPARRASLVPSLRSPMRHRTSSLKAVRSPPLTRWTSQLAIVVVVVVSTHPRESFATAALAALKGSILCSLIVVH